MDRAKATLGDIAVALVAVLVAYLLRNHVVIGLSSAIVICVLGIGLIETLQHRRGITPAEGGTTADRLDMFSAPTDAELEVTIETEEFHPFEYKAILLEVKVSVRNLTNKMKYMKVMWNIDNPRDGQYTAWQGDIEVDRALHALAKKRSPELPGTVRPGDSIAGWLFAPLPHQPRGGIGGYTLTIEDEVGAQYVLRRDRRGERANEPSTLKVSGEPDWGVESFRCQPSHRVEGEQLFLVLENSADLPIPVLRCVVQMLGGTPFHADVTNPFVVPTDAARIGPPRVELRFPQDFGAAAYLAPGGQHWVTWFDTTDDAKTSLGGDPAHHLAKYRFRTVL